MKSNIDTLYLLPHSHTDVGYSHDPVVAIELHDRFLDRAIALCEQTRTYPDGARFRWTVEVFSSLLHWWDNRAPADHARLRACLDRGEIDIGARYLNGTELYAPEDVAWEAAELGRMVELTGYRPSTAIQNDVNGFPLAFARNLATAGVNTLVMGLNTTMGHSPFPRCSAFQWALGDGRELLLWNGWIYNRIKTYCHLDNLGDGFLAKTDAFLASLPRDYPYDFAMTSATIGDNVGPFPALPDQVRQFNHHSPTLKLRLATFAEFATVLAPHRERLPVVAGNWPDFWTFGAGSMPQMVASLRRAQRRLRLVEQFRALGWANESGGTLTLERARRAIASACEHTYDSHTSAGEFCGTSDSLRQKAQIQVEAAVAESASMVLLRDHLTAMVADPPPAPLAVLAANPHPWPLTLDYLSERQGLLAFASSRRPEHLFQFDREPTFEALAAAGTFGRLDFTVEPQTVATAPLGALAAPTVETPATGAPLVLQAGGARLRIAAAADRSNRSDQTDQWGSLSWQPTPGVEVLDAAGPWPPFALVEERPASPFQVQGMEDMDPADAAWNPDLRFQRHSLPWPSAMRRRTDDAATALAFESDRGLLRRLAFALDARRPYTLMVDAALHFDADPTQRAYYLALPLALPGEGDCEYWIDGCGLWFEAEHGQLPNSCNSFYQAGRGIAVSRAGHTLYLASPDTTLFQFGGFTFGQTPTTRLQRQRPFVALWLYNNYWGTNFPSYSPGLLTARFRLEYRPEPFAAAAAEQLDASFDADYLTHPLATCPAPK